jgi:hypothetical protein
MADDTHVYRIETSDGASFQLTQVELDRFLLLHNAFFDLGRDIILPIPSVDSVTFQSILDFVRNSYGNANYIQTFMQKNGPNLRAIILAAQYLQVGELCDALSAYISGQIAAAGTAAAMKQRFGLRGSLTPAQQDAIQRRLRWAKP